MGGTKWGIMRVKAALENSFATESFQRACTKVRWTQCCQPRQKVGINLTHPRDTVTTFLFKWIVKALEPI